MKTLKLTLKKKPFEVMKTFEKTQEFRTDSQWIRSRLFHKNGEKKSYGFVQFSNGYYGNAPKITAKFKGFIFAEKDEAKTYSNGLIVNVKKGDIIISFEPLNDPDCENCINEDCVIY